VFDAMALRFDLDVAAPPGGPWHVPAARWYTAEDDGLTQPWEGLVWCNPPFSRPAPWAKRWASHPRGVLLGFALPAPWLGFALGAADCVAVGEIYFTRPDGETMRYRSATTVAAFRGVGVEPAERLAAAARYGAVMYGPRGRT